VSAPPDGPVGAGQSGAGEPRRRGRAARILRNRRLLKAVGVLLVLALLYYAFFVVLPSEIDWAELWADLKALSVGQIVALLLAGLLAIVALGWTSKASLPGLTLYQGTESSATSQLTAFAFPPPADMAIRFAMYRTYGFTDEQSAVAVLIAMVARYAMVAFMPLLGLALVLVTGQGTRSGLFWFLGIGIAFVVVMWLIIKVARSEESAHKLGRFLERASGVMRRFHRTPPEDLENSVVKFGARTRSTMDGNGRVLVLANVAWGLSNALVMLLVMRFSGLTGSSVSASAVVLTTGLVMAINMLPIPGKDALAVGWVAGILSLTSSSATNDLGTALLLYRVVTWILPMPVGLVAFLLWRRRVRLDTVNTEAPEGAEPPNP
jgi:uncharacterized membrane protein YbhN (UPF0104 family)